MIAMPAPGVSMSIAGFVVAVAGVASLASSGALFTSQPVPLTVQVLAFLLMIWARVTFGRRSFHVGADPTAGGIVTNGPYRFWRHPIYAAIIFFVWAGIAAHRQPSALLLGLGITGGLFVRMLAEERMMRAQYPAYDDYAARTRRLIPWVV